MFAQVRPFVFGQFEHQRVIVAAHEGALDGKCHRHRAGAVEFLGHFMQRRMVFADEDHLVEHHAVREEIAEHQHRPEALFWRLTARYGQLEMEAHLRWAEETLAVLQKLDAEKKKPTAPQKEKRHGRQ